MHISIIASDFDGTISQGERLAPKVRRALHHWRQRGQFTVLVSGRPFDFLHALQEREQVFDLIVAENGAVLYNPVNDAMALPFGHVPEELLHTLAQVGVPLWKGTAIAGTQMPYDDAVWVASRELGLPVHVEVNRNEVMVLPPGVSKGAGLLNLLKSEGLSVRNLVAFGDAENDHSLLEIAEVKVAVANAIDALKNLADYVIPEEGPGGVAAFIDHYLLGEAGFDFPVRGAHHFTIDAAAEIEVNAYQMVDRNLLIVGGSGYGKSWLASRLAGGLIDGGYQLLGLDPVGDLNALRRHATCLCLGREELPPTSLVVELLAETDMSLVVDLSQAPTPEESVLYTAGLLRRVLEVHRRYGKPHWLVIDEAQDLLGGPHNPAWLSLLRASQAPGVCLVTWQPSRLDMTILDAMDGFLLTRHQLTPEVDCLADVLSKRGIGVTGLGEELGTLGEGRAVMWGGVDSSQDSDLLVPFKFSIGPRTFPEMHRLHRYLEEKVAPSRQFYFHDEVGRTPPAGNLREMIDRIHTLDLQVIQFHFQRGDFARWVRGVLRDETLARWLDRLHATDLTGESLRQALLEALEQRHHVLERVF
ncbi:MAG TPA: HAD family phosphatase [Chloroflexi bacterium]|nr:HAD family phosphatase [Chloroflexota bacterium]